MARSTAALCAGDDDLRRRHCRWRLADLAVRRLAGDLDRGLEFESEERRHRALPDRHGALHGIAANAQQPRRVGELQAAGGGERRIFAERMAGDEGRVFDEIEPASASSTRMAARLTAISAGCALAVSVRSSAGPSHMIVGQLLAERLVDLVEHRPRLRKSLGERLAHADGLAALTGKDECARHADPVLMN